MMTEITTPTTPEEAAALTTALNAYHEAKVVEAREFIGSEAFDEFRGRLEAILTDGLPDGQLRQMVQAAVTVVSTLSLIGQPQPEPVLPEPLPPTE